ncbi:VanZ family protein [Halobacteriaceae bacterium SHR40]|uniref:VanZ family protein n=1 Tax=Halovenus amylolytica TaxID=2500550 RepID=UPI000FE43500
METPDDRFDSRWKSVVGTALVLLVASVLPSPLGRHPEFSRFGPDKLLHILGHAWLTVTLADAFETDRLDAVSTGIIAVSVSFVHGLFTGFLQQYVPGRVPERADLVAGLVGSVLGVLGWWYVSEARTPDHPPESHQPTTTENA